MSSLSGLMLIAVFGGTSYMGRLASQKGRVSGDRSAPQVTGSRRIHRVLEIPALNGFANSYTMSANRRAMVTSAIPGHHDEFGGPVHSRTLRANSSPPITGIEPSTNQHDLLAVEVLKIESPTPIFSS